MIVEDQNSPRKPIPWKVKKDHGPWQKKAQLMKLRKTMKAQRPKKKKKKKEKVSLPILQEANRLRESLGDPKKDVDSLGDPEKDVGDLEDRTNHSQVSLKDGKIC